jgi:hypothetical protein
MARLITNVTVGLLAAVSLRSSRLYPNYFCVVWSNFEIGNLNFWRGEAYMKFFEFLDSKGGFYYEVQQFTTSSQICIDVAYFTEMGRRTRAFNWSCTVRAQGPDSLLRGYRL